MKQTLLKSAIGIFTIAIMGSVSLTSCTDSCQNEMIYNANVPVYMSWEDLRKPAKFSPATTIQHPARIWRKDNYLFISDLNKGVHFVNISDVQNPQIIGFLEIPGVLDIAVKDNTLFADSFTDLLSIDISNPMAPVENKRLNDVFPYNPLKVSPAVGYPVHQTDQTKGVVVAWNIEKVTDKSSCTGGVSIFMEGDMGLTNSFTSGATGTPASFSGGGALASFTLAGDYLYAVSNSDMFTYQVSDPINPVKTSQKSIGWNIETLGTNGTYLFIGSRTGMIIYGLNNPANPEFVSTFNHANSCDPVIVQGNFAYVTLRNGTPCQNASNQLDVLNISNIQSPVLIKTYPMSQPWGPGIDGKVLVVCEADFGVKVYDASDANNITLTQSMPDLKMKDVILYSNLAVFMGDSGIWLYTYNSNGNFAAGGYLPVAVQ